jgi:2-polyprenyl-3-methyl-5-hydroxy-6-metoxy-1,4-benzoquinol methylase/glycosyltransferase involved in cell wall biosynthesis
MFIAIHAGGMPFNGETIEKGESLGGSETSAYYMAKELAALGHHVTVFTGHKGTGKWDGVTYEWFGDLSEENPLGNRFDYVMQVPFDVLIIQRHPAGFLRKHNSKLNLWWLHDLALKRNSGFANAHLVNVDKILTVSEFHRNQVSEIYDIRKEHIIATTNGVDYDLFDDLKDSVREPNSLFYMARPERGLMNLVGPESIMEMLPDCHLYVCGYDNTVPQMESMYKYLWSRCEELPNVTNLGHLGKKELYRALSKTMLYVYPTTFEDTSCIAALEANAAGVPFMAHEIAALPETMKDAGAMFVPLKDGKVDKRKFADTVERVFKDKTLYDSLVRKSLSKRQTWADAAKQWDALFHAELKKKCDNEVRVYKHMEYMSDIVPLDNEKAKAILPDFERNYGFYLNDTFKEHYEKYYQEHEPSKGVQYGPEDLTDTSKVSHRRFKIIADEIAKVKPETILDYGCAHGHYVMNLKKVMPDVLITGVDIEQSNIDTAIKWANESKVEGVEFYQGTHHSLDESKYDLIIAAEVLEHVTDPNDVVIELMKHLSTDGTMLISVPYGPWEAIGYNDPVNVGWRAHIHHFERQDLFEMYGKQKDYNLIALPWNEFTGHYVLTFKPSGEPLGTIDYERKFNQQAPKETLSVTMIVKDGEYTLGKTLSKLENIADEIIIGLDSTTTDNTRALAEKFGAEVFEIESPIKQGFDSARNKVMAKAKMDWILWIDDDETLEQVENLNKYLRPNCYDGYSIQQHHYAVEPAEKFKTDWPVRLFRNHKGVKFYGFVHEHPEVEFNKGVGKAILLPDVSIMHTGYATEKIRRERFMRNWPLMKIDHEKYPNRILGKFLWLRDLAHVIKYLLERNGNTLTAEMRGYAQEIITIWRWLLKDNHVRMACDALPWYSNAVQIMGNGIEYSIEIKTRTSNGGPLQGLFANVDDIKTFTEVVQNSQVDIYASKYF